jgi:hypothetical protein
MSTPHADPAPCDCPAGPCPHYPHDARGRFLDYRRGTSGLPRAQEVAYLEWLAGRAPASRSPPRPPEAPCVHRGGVLRADACPSCRGTVKVKVFACTHPVAGPETTPRRCQGCAYFDPRPPLPPPAPPG